MPKDLYWVEGSWLGKLAVGPRPRGGSWLKDDLASWKKAHIDAVLSLLTADEERDWIWQVRRTKLEHKGYSSRRIRFQIDKFPGQRGSWPTFWRELLATCRPVRMCSYTAGNESGKAGWWLLACL